MRKTIFYAVAALAFIPYAVLLLVGGIAVAIGHGLARLREWTYREGL